ncbi:MAG: hypothetical protein ACREQ4_14155 [Candidatus Binataceae bacterium]
MKNYCPVCGYDSLTKPPVDYNICPCCGTEFGYDDIAHSWDELRTLWLSGGARWFSKHTPAPAEWNVLNQVAQLNAQHMQTVAGTTNRDVTFPTLYFEISQVVQEPVRDSATTEIKKIDKVAA